MGSSRTSRFAVSTGASIGVPIGVPIGLRGTARGIVAAVVVVVALAFGGVSLPAHAEPTPTAAELDRKAAELTAQLGTVVEQYNTTQENLRATQTHLATVNAELAPLAALLSELQAKVGAIAARVYTSSALGPVDALLSAGSPAIALQQLTVLDHLARMRGRDITALQLASQQYDTQRRTLEALARQQTTQQDELVATKATIEASLDQIQALRAKAYGAARNPRPRAEPRDPYVPVFSPDAAGSAVRFAYKQLGKAYRWAGEGPEGYDCSGLTLASWRAAGVRLPHSSSLQWGAVAHIGREDLRPGDLVFYYRDIHHVAIFVGGGRIIHAPDAGQRVSIHSIDRMPIYGYGRVRHG